MLLGLYDAEQKHKQGDSVNLNSCTVDLGQEALTSTLDRLVKSLHDARHEILKPDAVQRGIIYDQYTGETCDGAPSELLLRAISTWDMPKDSVNGAVTRFPGLFEVDHAVLDSLIHLNACKDELEMCVKALEDSGLSPYKIRPMYAKAGFARIHPLQAWRRINLVDGSDLESVGFTVAKGLESIELLSYEESVQRLSNANAFDVAEQLVSFRNDLIRWHEPVNKHVRANVVWGKRESRKSVQLNASMPLVVEAGGWPKKRVRYNTPRNHAKRSDVKQTKARINLPYRDGAYITIVEN